jgi:CelD/BcsL family acetyltransferase involved in cellulose biosynthesis
VRAPHPRADLLETKRGARPATAAAPAFDTPPLAAAWRALEPFARWPTQLRCFTAALADTLLAPGAITLMVANAGSGDPGALLPLCRPQGGARRWRVAGSHEVFEPIDVLAASAAEVAALAEQLSALGQPLQLDRVPADSILPGALKRAMRGRALVVSREAMACPTIALAPEMADPLHRFNADRRSDFRRAARRAAALGAVTYEIHAPAPDQFDALFDEAVAVERHSWKADAGTAMATDPAKQAFFRAFLKAAAADGLARIAFLRIDGKAAAMQLALEWRGRFWLFKIGFDHGYGRCSPGNLLMLHTLGDAAARGLTGYELLGNIEPWISQLWTRDAHPCRTIRTYPANPAGLAALIADGARWVGRRRTWWRGWRP